MYVALLVGVVFSGGGIVLLVPPMRHVRFKLLLMCVEKIEGHVSIEFKSENGVGWAMLEAYAEDKERLRIVPELLRC